MTSTAKRFLICLTAFLLGSALMAAAYFGFLTWAQGWNYAFGQFVRDRAYVVPIILAFGIESALYSILRFRLFVPVASTTPSGAMVGASGATSTTAMVACCLHHVTNVLPILGIGAAAGFLARYQRPFMQAGLAMNLAGILMMIVIIHGARQQFRPIAEVE